MLAMAELMKRYPEKLFVCGMGASGAAFGYDGHVETQAALEIDREIVDTNGAGDSLAKQAETERVGAGTGC